MKDSSRRLAGLERRRLEPLSLEVLKELRGRFHGDCLACNDPMYRLEFELGSEGDLVTRFRPTAGHCSFRGVVHGGVVGLLVDEAMTCCLMAHGVVGVTGELKLRYHETVAVDEIELQTRVSKSFAPLYHLECDLRQGGELRVSGLGRFMRRSVETSQRGHRHPIS